jgi:hypothetical protein
LYWISFSRLRKRGFQGYSREADDAEGLLGELELELEQEYERRTERRQMGSWRTVRDRRRRWDRYRMGKEGQGGRRREVGKGDCWPGR